MEEKLLSVIVPVYNVEHVLDRCLQSISTQSYVNLEIILVEDKSTDESRIKCEEWMTKDKRIRLLPLKQNQGLAEARNEGLRIAHGEYLTFVDSDDFLENNAFEKMILAMEKDQSDIAYCGFWVYREDTGEKTEGYKMSDADASDPLRALLLERLHTVAWGKVLKRKVMISENEVDILFPKGRRYEDTVVSFKQVLASDKVSVLEEPLYYYVQSSVTITARPRFEDIFDLIANAEEIRRLLYGKVPKGLVACFLCGILVYALQIWYYMDNGSTEVKKHLLDEIARISKEFSYKLVFQSRRWKRLIFCKMGLIDLAMRLRRR